MQEVTYETLTDHYNKKAEALKDKLEMMQSMHYFSMDKLGRMTMMGADIKQYEMIRDACAKEINKIPKNGITYDDDWYECRVCDYELGHQVRERYCPNCGNKTEWSKE